MAIIKVITGNEHGGAANSTRLLINGIIESKSIDFEIVALCNDSFALELVENHPQCVTVIENSAPPIISNPNSFRRTINSLHLAIWFCISTLKLFKYLRKKNITAIHTTNNYALVVCCLYKYLRKFTLISHWRCVGYRQNLVSLHSNIDKFICISNSVKDSLPAQWQDKATVVYDGLNISQLKAEGENCRGRLKKYLNIDDKSVVFGTIGTFTAIKCHSLLIESCRILSEKNTDIEYRCILIGSTPNSDSRNYLAILQEKVAHYRLQNKIIFLLDDELDKPSAVISDFDFFVGSTWNKGKGEGFGLIYVEAMTQGLPIIAIEVGAAKEIINNEIGILLRDNLPEKHAEAIKMLCINSSLRKKMKINSINQSTKFDNSNTIIGVLAIYDQI